MPTASLLLLTFIRKRWMYPYCAETFGFEVIVDDAQKVLDHQDVFGVLLQQVGTTGEIHDYTALISELKSRKNRGQRCRRYYGAGVVNCAG